MSHQPRVVWMPGGVRTEIHLGAAQTGGAFCLIVDHPPARWSLPPHRHRGAAETIHVIEGDFELIIAGGLWRLGPGQTAHVPAGVIHSSRNLGAAEGRRVLMFSPAGMEDFFLEVGRPSRGAEAGPREAYAAAVRHGWEFTTARGERRD